MMGVVAGTLYTCLRAFVDCRSNLLCFLLLGTLFGRCIALLLLFFLFCYTIHAIKFYFSGIQNPLKHLRWSFYEKSERLQVVNYFSKKLHLSYLTVVLVRLWILLFSYFLVFHVFDSSMTIGSVYLVRQYSVLMFSLQIFKNFMSIILFPPLFKSSTEMLPVPRDLFGFNFVSDAFIASSSKFSTEIVCSTSFR